MISNIKIFLLCPIPEDQKPINEYLDLLENNFFNWNGFTTKLYNIKLLNRLGLYFLIFCFLRLERIHENSKITNWLVINLGLGLTIFVFSLVFNFLRWKDLGKKFSDSQIFYEESSWFDSQTWEKPFFLIKNDKLIFHQKIIPILRRLGRTIFKSLLLYFLFLLFFDFF